MAKVLNIENLLKLETKTYTYRRVYLLSYYLLFGNEIIGNITNKKRRSPLLRMW